MSGFDMPVERDYAAATQTESGEIVAPAASYPLPPLRNIADPFDDLQLPTVSGAQMRHVLQHSRRANQVDGWQVAEFIGSGNPDPLPLTNILRRSDAGGAIFLDENWTDLPGQAATRNYNPTMGGAARKPDARPLSSLSFSPAVHYRNGGDGFSLFAESGAIPLEWSADIAGQVDPVGNPNQNEGRQNVTEILWWRMRQFLRVDCHWDGRDAIHRCIAWSYFPRSWPAPASVNLATGAFLCDLFHEAHFYDPVTRVRTSFENLGGSGVTWNGSNVSVWNLDRTTGRVAITGDQVANVASPMTTGATAMMFRAISVGGSSVDVVLGFYVRLDNDPRGVSKPTQLIGNTLRVGGGSGRDSPSCQVVEIVSQADNRRPGWCGAQWWMVTETSIARCQARLDEIHASTAAVDDVPFDLIPEHMRAGRVPFRTGIAGT